MNPTLLALLAALPKILEFLTAFFAAVQKVVVAANEKNTTPTQVQAARDEMVASWQNLVNEAQGHVDAVAALPPPPDAPAADTGQEDHGDGPAPTGTN